MNIFLYRLAHVPESFIIHQVYYSLFLSLFYLVYLVYPLVYS